MGRAGEERSSDKSEMWNRPRVLTEQKPEEKSKETSRMPNAGRNETGRQRIDTRVLRGS